MTATAHPLPHQDPSPPGSTPLTELTTRLPLSSADSTNVARNVGIDKAWRGAYAPATREARADVLVGRIESNPTPVRLIDQPAIERLTLL